MGDEEKNQEKTYTEAEYKGIIKDLQGERSNRQQIQFSLDAGKRENESLRKAIEELKNSKPVELASDKLEFEGKDEDFATVKDVKRGFKSVEKESAERFKAAQKAARIAAEQEIAQRNFDESCRLAEIKYSKLASVGLDFKTVYGVALKRIGRNEYEQAAIFHSKDPGERLYKIGCEDPEIKMKLDLEENQELLQSMETRKVDKEILTGGIKIKSNEFFTPREVKNMAPSEAAKQMPKIEKSMAEWQRLRKEKK